MESSIEGIFLEHCNDACRVTEIQHKSIQVVAEGSGRENYLRNVAALCNLHTMFV